MLELKRVHPLPAVVLPKDFTLDLDRAETCVAGAHFDDYAKEHPLWGMPYALPGLAPAEEAAVVDWVNAGAPHAEPEPLPEGIRWSVAAWEAFLNEPSLKSRLMARYVYEHLFLASLSFDEIDPHVLFRLVRSRGPSPAPVDEIATRRPFEDPKVDRVYYRFVRRIERPLEKTLMPYPLGPGASNVCTKTSCAHVPGRALAELQEPKWRRTPFGRSRRSPPSRDTDSCWKMRNSP